MTDTERPTAATLARHYYGGAKFQEELRGNWVMAVLHRPPGFVLATIAIRSGISANTLTAVGLIIALLLPVLGWVLPVSVAAWAVFALGSLVVLLDCADGDVARWTGSASPFGARFDLLVDMSFWGLLYSATGLIADRALDGAAPGLWTAVALAAAWLRMLARVLNDDSGAGDTDTGEPFAPREILPSFFTGLSGATPFVAIFVVASPWAVALLLAYALLDVVAAAIALFARTDA